MTEHPMILGYIERAGLETANVDAAVVALAVRDLLDSLEPMPEEVDRSALYRYVVPKLSEDGSCSLIEEMSPTPYDLSVVLGGKSDATTRKLWLLNQLVDRAASVTGADWVGIYLRWDRATQPPALVKLAYRGRPSRAEFPLTAEFAQGSTNSSVGLSGRTTVIHDVAAYAESGGGFYVCDDAVQSEACLPILDAAGNLTGILDAEAAPKSFFTSNRLAVLVAACLLGAGMLP